MKFNRYLSILWSLFIVLIAVAANTITASSLLGKTLSLPVKLQEKKPPNQLLKKDASAKQSKVPEVVIKAQLEHYFLLKPINLAAAKLLLQVILSEEPNQRIAKAEMGYLLLAEKSFHEALIYFRHLVKLEPSNLAFKRQLYDLEKNWFNLNPKKNIAPSIKKTITTLDKYYQLKSSHPKKAKWLLTQWLIKHPQDIHAQKEMGYLLLTEKQPTAALSHFKIVACLSPQDYPIKMQIAYLLDGLNRKREAYDYFNSVTNSDDKTLRLSANQAMTNLAGIQTQFFNKPWFADVYCSPFYLSRFQLLVYPVQARIGRTYGCHNEWEIYGSVRAVNDNKSRAGNTTIGQLPQIYQDAFVLPALGFRYRPFYKKFPYLNLYAEAGKAYNLVLQTPNEPLWRNDFRGGLFFSNNWGSKPHYADTLSFPFSELGSVYNDISYYSRYANMIGYLNVNEGTRLLEYHAASLDVYAGLRSGADTQHQFYNNFFEIGPGIVFTPNNRYGLRLRAEFLKGYYIPVNSPNTNPYGPNYYNTLVIAEFYLSM